jgi:NAD(P)-dependent dehydrogenase (short-subunit alcohol dehydrogenase family)
MSGQEKYALITGGSRGIGRGIALKLAEGGARVAINYVANEAAAKTTLAQVRERGGDGFVIQADVSQPDDIRHMFQAVQAEFGKLDIFVSNARPEIPDFYAPPLTITPEPASELLSEGGRIIAVTYAAGSRTGSWQAWIAMGSAKAAMESALRYFAVALAKRGITVNAVSPGFTEDSVLNSLPPAGQELIRNWHADGWTPMGRLGTPADIGKVVALLCSEDAGWITGQVIMADGGASLMNPELPLALQAG